VVLTDTHCHLDMSAFDADRESVLQRAAEAGIVRILVPSLNQASAERALALTANDSSIFVAVGIHPTEVPGPIGAELEQIQHLAANPRVVAIGEIGLDYFWVKDDAGRARQRAALRAQLELAGALQLPVVLHLREELDAGSGACTADMMTIVEDWVTGLRATNPALAGRPGVFHSFSGSPKTAAEAVQLGFSIGVTGPVTYKNADTRRQLIASLPLDKLLIETDSPFLAPDPQRGRRNEPAFVVLIADRIAELQSCPPGEVANVTTANAERLFGWGKP
jgi:TatD DNase family protein